MKKIVILLSVMLFMVACENDIDNYDAPNGGVHGTIYDKETNEPIPMPVPGSARTAEKDNVVAAVDPLF